ncbi:calcium-binding protein, putative [Leishmania donovani]|uniref:Calcium-binding protein, putative n=1 Tax=Leishmania donovani TaxID=5661 RepID=A0A3Q8IBX6_LEIDO|nr:calcium-binding protein, putative [Leishmania donovani]
MRAKSKSVSEKKNEKRRRCLLLRFRSVVRTAVAAAAFTSRTCNPAHSLVYSQGSLFCCAGSTASVFSFALCIFAFSSKRLLVPTHIHTHAHTHTELGTSVHQRGRPATEDTKKMSVRMDASLYSDVVRIERGDYLRFHCEQLSADGRDTQRYFFGCYYPRWHGFYLEEVRSIIGNMGYCELKHFPAYPFDVYLKPADLTAAADSAQTYDADSANVTTYITDDFQVNNILVLGPPQNQRDDAVKRFKIVSVDVSHLKTKTLSLAPVANLNSSSIQNPNTMLSTLRAPGGERVPVQLESPVLDILTQLRDAYIDHAGGGIPEIGIKAMGRPFRKVSDDGRRWMTRDGVRQLVRGSRAFGAHAGCLTDTRNALQTIEAVADTIFSAFPHEEATHPVAPGEEACEERIDYDVFMDYVRGHMNSIRKKAVLEVFQRLDYDSDGNITIKDIQATFNAQEHPVVVSDAIFTAEKLLKGFLAIWDENQRHFGLVPYTEFMDYYNGLSAVIEDDAVFVGILKTTWKVPNWTIEFV